MDDLASWLEAQIAEDERGARAASAGPWTAADTNPESIYDRDGDAIISGGRWGGEAGIFDNDADAWHIARWDPARVLAECEAKRRVIKLYTNALNAHRAGSVSDRNRTQDEAAVDVLGAAIQEYGAMYAKLGRPGYQESWKP